MCDDGKEAGAQANMGGINQTGCRFLKSNGRMAWLAQQHGAA
jgi:hypothetical protein